MNMKLTKQFLIAGIAALCLVTTGVSEPLVCRTQALTTGTAFRVASTPTRASSLFIQSAAGNAAIVYVLYADPGTTCSTSTTTQIVAQLGIGTATSPGQSFTFPSNNDATTQAGGIDVQRFCVQGSTSDN